LITPTDIGRRFYRGAMLSSLVIGGLQMFHVRGGIVTNYGADFLGTAWIYAMTRLGVTVFQRGRGAAATPSGVITFVLCTGSEFGQRMGIVPGHFDPYDILTFALSVGACLALEQTLGPFASAAAIDEYGADEATTS
jgi:hypothetical protein